MDAATHAREADRRMSLAATLRAAWLPGPLARRAPAAARLPLWVVLPMGILCLGLSIEVVAYIYAVATGFLQVIYGRWEEAFHIPPRALWIFVEVAMQHVRLHVFTLGAQTLPIVVGTAAAAAGLMESLNLVMLAPLAAVYGQPLSEAGKVTRRVLLSLGGVWLLGYCLAWVVVFLIGGIIALHSCQTLRIRVAYVTLDTMMRLGFAAVLLLIALGWLMRLMRAASYLWRPLPGPLPSRCGRCGYLLVGLGEGSCCPDCGQARPADIDQGRVVSPWLARRTVGRWRTLGEVSAAIARRPRQFFGRLSVLGPHREVVRFVRWNLWLTVGAWGLALPGIAAALIDPDEFLIGNEVVSAGIIAGLLGLMCGVAGLLLLGLVISVMGFAIGVAREEPGWPIAAEAGCYLSAWLPRVSAWQALWVTGLFTAEQLIERGMLLRLARHGWIQTGIPWEIVLGAMFSWPMMAGLAVITWSAMVCCRQVRYACR